MTATIDPKNPPAVHEWTGPTGVKFRDVREPSGTYYHDTTPRAVIDILERAMREKMSLRLFYGDRENGRDWMSESDVCGTVGRSTGWLKIALIIGPRGHGGPGILADSIVRIMHGKCELYRHPKYIVPKITVRACTTQEKATLPMEYCYAADVQRLGSALEVGFAHFTTQAKALRWAAFMRGERAAR